MVMFSEVKYSEYWEKICKYSCKGTLGGTVLDNFQIPTGLRHGCVLLPLLFSIFIMVLAELEMRSLGVKIKGHWMGACFLRMTLC